MLYVLWLEPFATITASQEHYHIAINMKALKSTDLRQCWRSC